MATISQYSIMDNEIIPTTEAKLAVTSSATLYGLSVYSVFLATHTDTGWLLFRFKDHLTRLHASAKMIGFTIDEELLDEKHLLSRVSELFQKNQPQTDQFCRLTLHATSEVPGVKTSGLTMSYSLFTYNADSILPASGARLKTSLWRRTADTAIPARAKVNGAYVNSALAKQDAIDSGCDDCLLLNQNGYVSELSAANIFMIKGRQLITPDCASDILEGITRKTIIELSKELDLELTERKVALTELYTADEVFACGTSAGVAPIIEIDRRKIGAGEPGAVTNELQAALAKLQSTDNELTVSLKK